MYHGEVNVAQDDINQFLATAEELQVKGLTHRDKDQKENEPEESAPGSPPPIDNIRVKSEPSTVSLSATDNSQEGSLPEDEYQDNTLAQHDAAATYQEEIVDYPEGGYGDDAGIIEYFFSLSVINLMSPLNQDTGKLTLQLHGK